MNSRIRIALAGNPNSGKTSVFNSATGAHQRVGNYPGVTVERKVGRRRCGDLEVELIDLPGAYSLTAYSAEEAVARDDLVDNPPDAVVCVVDASNLERNLYLVVQLLELGLPMVVALNMVDVARSRGIEVDAAALSDRLGVPVVPTVGHRGRGVDTVVEAAIRSAGAAGATGTAGTGGSGAAAGSGVVVGSRAAVDRGVAAAESDLQAPGPLRYGGILDASLAAMAATVHGADGNMSPSRTRWVALKLLERDEGIRLRFATGSVEEAARRIIGELEAQMQQPPELAFAGARYKRIDEICARVVRNPSSRRRTRTARIDALVTHRIFGVPVFLALMFGVFQLTFAIGDPMMDGIEMAFNWLGGQVASWWPNDPSSPLRSLIVDGIIGGAGGVLVFLPNILLLFLAISLLESSGYMARAAFITDRLMQKIGLHGKSFIPMLIGFGCSVPAIMATRTLDNRRDRLATMLVIPLISCSARLPIYLLIIPAFFPRGWHAPMLWLIYVIGIFLAITSAKLLSATVLRGSTSTFLMELPPYKVPTLKQALIEMWGRGSVFLRKVGTMILGATIVMWALTSFPSPPRHGQEAPGGAQGATENAAGSAVAAAHAIEMSAAGRIGKAMEPVIRPMGFDWKIGTALIGAIAAKEVFVAQMGVIYSIDGADSSQSGLRRRLRRDYGPLVAFCVMLFALISSPCMSTVVVTRRESNSWRWALFQYWGLTLIAYAITVGVYQIGMRLAPLIQGA